MVECVAEALLRCSINLPDPYYSNVVFLAGFEGTNGAITYREEKHHFPATFDITAQIDSSQFKFGTSSLLYSVTFVDDPFLDLSSANSDQFTIEGFCNFSSVTFRGIMAHGNTIGNRSWGIELTNGSTSNFTFKFTLDGSTEISIDTSGGTIATDRWFAFAVDKDSGGKIRVYIDGVMRGSATPANSAFFPANSYLIVGALMGFGERYDRLD